MAAGLCGWIGCKNLSEATLDARPLCRKHFYDIASRRLADYRERFAGADPVGRDRVAASAFLSELIGQAGTLVTGAKELTAEERDDFLALSTDAVEMYKRVQRNPRIPLRVPVRVYRAPGSKGKFELTATVNVSKAGACVTTREPFAVGANLWIQKTENSANASGCVTWVKEVSASQFLIGFEILDHEDFWNLKQQSSSDPSPQNAKTSHSISQRSR
ncbi:MAG: PilZ domain-containing protein [Candidatus Acidiferrales bacterium]